MSIIAKLYAGRQVYNVLQAEQSIIQRSDGTGRPTSRPFHTGSIAVIESTKDTYFFEKAIHPTQQIQEIILEYINSMPGGRTRRIRFVDCYVTLDRTDFEANGREPITETVLITAAGIEDSHSQGKYTTLRQVTPFLSDEIPVTAIETPQTAITRITWNNDEEQEEDITEIKYTQKASLTAQIENPMGSTATIIIEKEDGTEFESGKTQLAFTETLTEDGMVEITPFEIKEQWEEFKTADIDKLIAKVEHKGISKTSRALQIIPPPKVIVDFRPSKGYDGEYGFDYMRNKKEKNDTLTYKDILGTNKSVKGINTFTKYKTDTKYNDLKDNQYKTITFPWYKDSVGKEIEYIQSWLTIYPKETQTLSLQIETIENAKKLELTFEYDKTFFKLNTEKIPAQSKGKKRLYDYLTIECLKEFSTDQVIKVMYEKQQLGQLNILANTKAKRKKVQVVFVKVETELVDGKTKFGDTTNKTGKPEKEMLTRYLKQAYTRLDLDEITFDLTISDPTTKKPKYPDFNKDYTLLDIVSNPISPPKILNKYHNKGGDSLAEYMEKTLNEEQLKYKDYFKVFFFGDTGGRKDKVTKIVKLAGYAKNFNTQSAIMFNGKRKATVTHELLHCMGLRHSFANGATYGYKKEATQNIMDYSTTRKHTWLWQWKKLWTNKDLKKE